jgi:hypothetical protein
MQVCQRKIKTYHFIRKIKERTRSQRGRIKGHEKKEKRTG